MVQLNQTNTSNSQAMLSIQVGINKSISPVPEEPVISSEFKAREQLLNEEKTFVKAGLPLQPKSLQEADLVDKLLADELAQLSFEEKERVQFDCYGMSHAKTKDPDNVDALLEQVELEIRQIPNKTAYEKAKYLNEDYVTDRAFRLMFLRLDDYDVNTTANRIVSHFETKKFLYGDGAVLGRDVLLSDVSTCEDDEKGIQNGCFQILPFRDAAGRLVLFYSPNYRDFADTSVTDDCMMRYAFYVYCTVARYEDVQLNGLVSVAWYEDGVFANWEAFSYMLRITKKYRGGLPRKIAAVHMCSTGSQFLRPFLTGIRWFLRADMRAKTRLHFGDTEQIMFELQTFGIPTEHLPLPGVSDLENHRQWIATQRKREAVGGNTSDIIVPRRFDVLFGRGNHCKHHSGNMRAGHIADMFREKYEAASKHEKTAIAERIVILIRESHGRFLKWEDDEWVEVDRHTARNKISHLFRNTRKKGNANKAPVSSDDSVSGGSTSTAESTLASSCSKRSQPDTLEQFPPLQKRFQTAVV